MIKLSLSFKGRILKVFRPTSDEIRIGRSPECEIQIENLGVSPVHARIVLEDDEATLVDTSEDGSVLVNGNKVTEHRLTHGDAILIGKHTITVSEEAGPAPEAAAGSAAQPLRNGWLQFLSGPKLGRTIRLDRTLVRLGKTGKHAALIASRSDGYYVSHLEGEPATRVRNQPIGDESVKLNDGDTIQVGDVQMLFFTDNS